MFLKYNTWQDFRCIELAQLEFALKTENNLRGTGDRTKPQRRKNKMSEVEDECALLIEEDYQLGLHVGSLFIIMGCSLFGTLLPVVAKRFPFLSVKKSTVFSF